MIRLIVSGVYRGDPSFLETILLPVVLLRTITITVIISTINTIIILTNRTITVTIPTITVTF